MNEKKLYPAIPQDQFAFVGEEGRMHDKKLEIRDLQT